MDWKRSIVQILLNSAMLAMMFVYGDSIGSIGYLKALLLFISMNLFTLFFAKTLTGGTWKHLVAAAIRILPVIFLVAGIIPI